MWAGDSTAVSLRDLQGCRCLPSVVLLNQNTIASYKYLGCLTSPEKLSSKMLLHHDNSQPDRKKQTMEVCTNALCGNANCAVWCIPEGNWNRMSTVEVFALTNLIYLF